MKMFERLKATTLGNVFLEGSKGVANSAESTGTGSWAPLCSGSTCPMPEQSFPLGLWGKGSKLFSPRLSEGVPLEFFSLSNFFPAFHSPLPMWMPLHIAPSSASNFQVDYIFHSFKY